VESTAEAIAAAVAKEAGAELDDALLKIKHCMRQLTDEQVWWRPAASMNSIANLILHVCGNLRQWITSGVGGAEDARDRPKEFSERDPIAKNELLRRLDVAVAEAKAALANASATDLLQQRRIQGFDVTGLGAIFHSVSHFRGHTQEIIHMTRCLLADDYKFAFVPTTPEQGAAQK
jgi:uncharacterized damage-inducible protein DinB